MIGKNMIQAGTQDYLLRSLLAQAQRDLAEARLIAERGGMRLYLANYHLESARLAVAQGQAAEARLHLATGKEMVEEMGYHRRDGEVRELEAAL